MLFDKNNSVMLPERRKPNKRDFSRQEPVEGINLNSQSEKIREAPRKMANKVVPQIGVKEECEYQKIEEAPTIYLTKEQMQGDPLFLLTNLQKKYKQYGAVKLVASQDWNPPFCFRFTDRGITTRIQHLNKLKKGKAFSEKEQAYNILSYTSMAQNFQKTYKYRTNPIGNTRQLKNQHQYWKLVSSQNYQQNPQFRVTVQYAADLPVKKYGSGFPLSQTKKTKDSNFDYYRSLFNLNNIYESPLSLMKIAKQKKEFISGVTSPWVYMGMMFSSFCWHVEDLWINSINYSHKGAIKTWYVIPSSDKQKFDAFVARKTGDHELLDKITFMIDPLQVKKAGINVYKINQTPKSYVCTFFKAYHCGFSQGFNIGQAVNFASPQSLIYIKEAMSFYEKKKPKKQLVLPYQWLVYANKKSDYKFGSFDKLVNNEYSRVLNEQSKQIQAIKKKYAIRKVKQFSDSFKYDKYSCKLCHGYLYLWYLKCQVCDHIYCVKHATNCCGSLSLYVRQPEKDRQYLQKMLPKKSRCVSANK